MSGRYAKNTTVPVDRSIAEIERLMEKYGADQFMTGKSKEPPRQFVIFRVERLPFRIEIPMPEMDEFRVTHAGYARGEAQAEKEYQQEIKRRWRVMCLIVKALLEGVDSGVWPGGLTEALQPFLMLPDNRTVREAMTEQIDKIYAGELPNLLPAPRAREAE